MTNKAIIAAAMGATLGAALPTAWAYSCGCNESWSIERLSECPEEDCPLGTQADVDRDKQGTRVTVGDITIWLED